MVAVLLSGAYPIFNIPSSSHSQSYLTHPQSSITPIDSLQRLARNGPTTTSKVVSPKSVTVCWLDTQ